MLYFSHSGYAYSKKRCESIVNWFVEEYLPRHKISIHVDHKGLAREHVLGWCWNTDSDSRPRDFEIEIDNQQCAKVYMETLLHELWHVRQHVMGHLKKTTRKKFWKGVDHTNRWEEDDDYNSPWEWEARKMEKVLYKKYHKLFPYN